MVLIGNSIRAWDRLGSIRALNWRGSIRALDWLGPVRALNWLCSISGWNLLRSSSFVSISIWRVWGFIQTPFRFERFLLFSWICKLEVADLLGNCSTFGDWLQAGYEPSNESKENKTICNNWFWIFSIFARINKHVQFFVNDYKSSILVIN